MRSALVVLVALGLALAGAGPAAAEPPVSLSDRVTDEVGALGGGESATRAALDDLAAQTDLELYAVLVSSFDGASDSDWVDRTAQLSELGDSDVLLAVAVGEDDAYEYAWWVDEASPLSEVEVEDVITSDVVPEFDAGNWDLAVTTLAEELQSMADSAEEEEAPQRPAWSGTTTLLVVGGLAVVLVAAHLFSRRRARTQSSR